MAQRWTRAEVLRLLELSEEDLMEFERAELVREAPGGLFEAAQVERLRICRTLRHDLGVNLEGVEVALHLLERLQAERRQFLEALRWLREELNRRAR